MLITNPTKSWEIVDLPVIPDNRGCLSFIEGVNHLEFNIERIYYLYNVPSGSMRAGHAHKELKQLMIPMSGSFTIFLDDGTKQEKFTLNNPMKGLYINKLVWRELYDFSQGAVCLVLASMTYDESDYYRNKEDFLANISKEAFSL